MIKSLYDFQVVYPLDMLDTIESQSKDQRVTGVILDTRKINLDEYPDLKVISRVGVGLDNIDLKECKQRGIQVYNTPCEELYYAVAEFIVRQMLNLFITPRKCLSGMTVGIIGYGNIGTKLDDLLYGFGTRILWYDNDPILSPSGNNLYALLERADIVCVCISGNDCVLGKNEINILPFGTYVVNVARKGCVDTKILARALAMGGIGGYASDVDGGWTDSPWNMYGASLLRNVLLTPHIASSTREARQKMEEMAIDNLIRGLQE